MFERLYFLRESKDMSQEELAKVLGITRSNISKWEKGTVTIPLKHLLKYANYFNVSIDYIVGLSDKKEIIIQNIVLDKAKIAKRLKDFRKQKNLSLRELAHELNTTSSTISAYETEKCLILTSFAYQIAKNYGLSMDWLLGLT